MSMRRRIDWRLRQTKLWQWGVANSRGPVYLGAGLVLTRSAYGHKILVSGLDRSVAPSLILDAMWEPAISRLILNDVKPKMRAIDIGAHVGWYTLLMCRQVGSAGKVVAFEPSPASFPLLLANVKMNGYQAVADCRHQALGDESGSATLMEPGDSAGAWTGSATLSHGAIAAWRGVRVTERLVTVVRLDDLDLGKLDFVKIDAEGSEERIWRGGRRTLSDTPRILLEYAPRWLSSGIEFLREVADSGFRFYVVEENGRIWGTDVQTAHDLGLKRGLISLLLRKRLLTR